MQSRNQCPTCKAEVLAEARFCNKCGYMHPTTPAPELSQPRQFKRPTFQPVKEQPPGRKQLVEQKIQHVPVILPQTESFVATSIAAERWRTSWRNRQRQEAGPATTVSRGQSSVPEPLLAMQNSLARMRAIAQPRQSKRHTNLHFWMLICLLVCLLGGIAIYITSTYLPNSTILATLQSSSSSSQPSLELQEPQDAVIHQGQSLHVHGENFAAGDPILFLLDGSTPIGDTNSKEIAIEVTNAGMFDAVLPVTSTWSVGEHVIQAKDKKTGQDAFLDIQVISSQV